MGICNICGKEKDTHTVPERIFRQIKCECHNNIGFHVEQEHEVCDNCVDEDQITTIKMNKDKLDTLQLPYSIITLYNTENTGADPIEIILEGGFPEYHIDDYITLAKENKLEGRYIIVISNMIGNIKIELEFHVLIFKEGANGTWLARVAHVSDQDLEIWNNIRK